MFRFYDDELHNLVLVANKSVKEIISYLSIYDYHPPFQYIVNKFFLQIFGLNEFWLKLPSMLLILGSILICSVLVKRFTGSSKAGLISGVISIVNPLVLLWGTSIRWYPLWTFLTMLSIYFTLSLFTHRVRKIRTQILLAITLTLALYTNYQTILLVITLLLSAIILDLKSKDKKFIHLKSTLPVIIGVIILFLPYINTFVNHLSTYIQQKHINSGTSNISPLISGGYFIFSVLFGNSIYPWDIIFIIFSGIIVLTLFSILAFPRFRKSVKQSFRISKFLPSEKMKEYFTLFLISGILSFLLFLFSILSNSLQARGYLIVPLLLITISSTLFYYSGKVKSGRSFNPLIIIACSFIFLWLAGSFNVITRESLHKASLMDPVGEVINSVQSRGDSAKTTYLIFTYDPVLTYYLLKECNDKNVIIYSPYKKELMNLTVTFNRNELLSMKDYTSNKEILYIDSYPGSLEPIINKLNNIKQYLLSKSIENKKPIRLGFDPDAGIKRKLFPSAGVIDWRYTIFRLAPERNLDYNIIASFNSLKVN